MRNAKSAKASPILPVGQASAREKKVASPHFPLSVGVRFIEPVFSGRINPLPQQNDFRTFCMSDETEKVYQKLEEAMSIY